MQNGKSRIKRVASAIIAGVMALQTVAPVISYADDTASSVATTDDSDAIANVDPGTPVQVDATASEEPSEAPSSGTSQADENSEETETNSDITDEVSNEHTDADTADETQTVEEDAPKQDESTSETTDTAPSRTVTVTLNKNGGEFEPEWLETANEDPIAAYLGTETNDIVVEDTGDTIVATVTDRDSIDIPVALSSDESLYFTGWDVSSGSYDADSETLTFEDGVDAYVLSAVYSSVVDDDQTLVENRTEFDEQTKRQAIQERLKSSGISTYAGTVTKGTDGYTFTIKNDHTPAVVDIPVTKVWNDDEDRDGLRPNSIHVTLTGSDGSTYKKDLEKDSGYSTIFTSLPKYHNGELISYSLAETPVEGYETDIQAAESGYGFTITNTHEVSKKTIKVSKVWDDAENQDGIRPDSVTVTLTGSNNSKYTAKLNKENNWTYTFEGLFCKADGATIKYEVSEKDVAGYTPSIKETEGGFIITNAHKPETVTINIVKNWNDSQNADNIRPDAISITLTGSDNSSRSITLNKAGDYKTAVDSLPKFHEGKQITYTVTETPVDGYTSSVQASADGYSFVVINTHTPEVHQEKKETPTTPKFEIKAEPSTTIIQTTNKPTGVSFFDSLLG